MPHVVPVSIEIGSFQFAGKIRTFDQLLTKLAKDVPAAFANHQIASASFTAFFGEQWGVLAFRKSAFDWMLGVQFYRRTGKGAGVTARIRYGGGPQGPNDPTSLAPVMSAIQQAMQAALDM